jgi:hypothetical protein
MSDTMYDVRPEQYPMVIREMIRHENDLTNHRIMWSVVGEGFIANAYVLAKAEDMSTRSTIAIVGVLVALSAFVMLYRSYKARGYLQVLGLQAKQGKLREEQLPLVGWPRNRIKDWWRNEWVCPWFRQTRDLFEPWLLLPFIFTFVWIGSLLNTRSSLQGAAIVIVDVILSAMILSTSGIAFVWSRSKDNKDTEA